MNCALAVAVEIYVADTGRRIRLEKDIADCGRLTKISNAKKLPYIQ